MCIIESLKREGKRKSQQRERQEEERKERKEQRKEQRFRGKILVAMRKGETPVPIPNTTVKP